MFVVVLTGSAFSRSNHPVSFMDDYGSSTDVRSSSMDVRMQCLLKEYWPLT